MEPEVYRAFSDSVQTEMPKTEFLTSDVVGVSLVVVDGYYGAIMEQDRSAPMLCFHLFLGIVIGFLVFL